MGTLIAMTYPITLFAKLADHTYVQCGTGAVSWSCWGRSTGGTQLRTGTGSTNRANSIAQRDERANIKCYLINGVCHQAANRILLPARITVRGARGYSVSQAMFATYGRPGLWPCHSPFKRHSTVSGDMPECVVAKGTARATPSDRDRLDWQFLKREIEIYNSAADLFRREPSFEDAMKYQLACFENMMDLQLGPMLDRSTSRKLLGVRRNIEQKRFRIEEAYRSEDTSAREFVDSFDELTLEFQDNMANAMSADEYESFFELKRDERIKLADPEIVQRQSGVGERAL